MPPDPADLLTERIRDLLPRASPVRVALDGRSGVGKSTLAATVAGRLASCAVVEGDDFYAGGTEAEWDARSAEEKAARVMDWRRQRPVLEALGAGRPVSFHAYDWDAFDGRLEASATTCFAAPVVILEGAYSARPELADLLDLRVLLTTDDDARRARLRRREGDGHHDAWSRRWAEAEVHYFGHVMPPEAFDLVLHSPPEPGGVGQAHSARRVATVSPVASVPPSASEHPATWKFDLAVYHATSRAQWRAWLEANHDTAGGVWLCSWRAPTGRPRCPYPEVVEEALCFGWIDSTASTLDDERGLQLVTPRKPKSSWTRLNRQRVAAMDDAGLMTEAGRRAVRVAQDNGFWTIYDPVEDLIEPEALTTALDAEPAARQTWDGFPPSARKMMLWWVVSAVRDDTRSRRIEAIVAKAAVGERAQG